MGPLWLGGGGGRGVDWPKFYTDNRRGYIDFLKGGGGISQAHPPLDIVCVTSSALRKIEKHPPPTIAAAQKKDRRCQKTE